MDLRLSELKHAYWSKMRIPTREEAIEQCTSISKPKRASNVLVINLPIYLTCGPPIFVARGNLTILPLPLWAALNISQKEKFKKLEIFENFQKKR